MLTDPLAVLPPDPLFALFQEFLADPRPEKVNLGIGVYAAPDGKPFVFPSVREAARALDFANFNYDPIGGNPKFLALARKTLFGDAAEKFELAAQQTCGGTHALAVFAELAKILNLQQIAWGSPTWPNHNGIFADLEIIEFPHLSDGRASLANYEQTIDALAPKGILLLHGGPTHNPTGFNLPVDELGKLAGKINAKEIFVFVDFAYLGLGDGLDADREFAIALLEKIENIAFGLSFSKNASMYKQRLGALFVKSGVARAIESNLQKIIRRTVSNLPGFGAEVMARVLGENESGWRADLENARRDIDARRNGLLDKLPPRFADLKNGRGLFGLLGLEKSEVEKLKNDFAIYLPGSARINFGGIQTAQIDRIAEAITAVAGN
ncbi:MAG: aminotransferase class I/II-fold pyridoxal phosphate-dependent enzyme [Patescibacteria group bacterium]